MNNSTTPTIIVGGGFVGLFTALYLSHHNYSEPIILIDTTERFVFKPLLYEYITGEMYDKQVLPHYKELLTGTKVAFVQDKVTGIDLEQRSVELASGLSYDYRYLVLGVGSSQGYFGTKGAKENAFPFRTGADAVKLERHIRQCLQRASQTESQAERSRLLTIESLTQIKAESKDKHGSPKVSSTLQLLDFPEVFAAGDCATVKDHPFPPVAQIAYQQGQGIAQNIIALAQGKEPEAVEATMRGTLMKLGLSNGVANLFDKMQVKGKVGNRIRNHTYLGMLPTPSHNFKATANWLTDEIFHRHHSI